MHVQDNSCLNVTDSDLFPDLTECVKGPFVNSSDSWVETSCRWTGLLEKTQLNN